MSPGEIAWRVTQSLGSRLEKSRAVAVAPAPDTQAIRMLPWSAPQSAPRAHYVEAAEAILAGRVDLFGEPAQVGFPEAQWNRDPACGKDAPMDFGMSIDYRDAALVGSARNIWEVNRHFQFVTLAQAWAVSGDARYRQAALDLIASWLRACPYPLGVNWTSALEHGIRLINWYFSARLLKLTASEVPAGWLDSIYHHCRFIARHRSRYSSANNHLIGEAAGLFMASCAWPCWSESARWRAEAKRILESEAQRQVHEDGVSREQTMGYQIFVLHLLIAAGLAGEAHGAPFSKAYWETVRRMITLLRSVADVGGNIPDFGDRDDGVALVLSPNARPRALADLLELDEAWSGHQVGGLSGEGAAAWLLEGFPIPATWPRGAGAVRTSFPEGGYFVLGGNFGQPDEVKLVFDAAPMGYLAIAAHGHADCLSFTLSIAGRPVLIDPGTFCYHDHPEWRDHFRSTAAHNTVRIDGEDQSVSGGLFMWLRKAKPAGIETHLQGERQSIQAQHDGYRRFTDPVVHRREVKLDMRESAVKVLDTIECNAAHAVERFWHFAPDCVVTKRDDGVVIAQTETARLELSCRDGEFAVFSGSESPRAGWYSARFGSRQKTTTVVFKSRVQRLSTLETGLSWRLR